MTTAIRPAGLCLGVCLLLAGAACARKPVTAPQTGRVTVGVTARGPAVAALAFSVSIDPAGIRRTIRGDAGVVTVSEVAAGEHVVRLGNLPGRCRVDGPAERTIAVGPRRSAIVKFAVTCD